MVRRSRLLGCFVLFVLVSGCASSSFSPATLPPNIEKPGSENADKLLTVRVGSTVQVELITGAVISGEVAEVSSNSLVVLPSYEYGGDRVFVDLKDIRSIGMQHADLSERVVVISVIGGLVAGFVWLASEFGTLAGN